MALKQRVDALDEDLGRRFCARPEARILSSFPGMGFILGAEFLVSVGDFSAFGSADRLAAYAGLPPPVTPARGWATIARGAAAKGSSSGSSTSPPSPACATPPSPGAFYDRKRHEGKRHSQAVIAPA